MTPCLTPDEFVDLVDGALAASVFHSGQLDIGSLKAYLGSRGIEVRT